MLTSPRLSVSLEELERSWTLDDLLDAHDALDVWDELEREQAKAASGKR